MSTEQSAKIDVARQALLDTIERFFSGNDDDVAAVITALTMLFADTCVNAVHSPETIAIVNRQLAEAGLEIVVKPRN